MKSYPLPDDIQPLFENLKRGLWYDLRVLHERLIALKKDYDLAFLVVIFYLNEDYEIIVTQNLLIKRL